VSAGAISHSRNATFSFGTSVAGDAVRYECKLDSGDWAWCNTSKTYEGLSMGTHTFSVRATDRANNTDPAPETRTWQIDTLQSFHTSPDPSWPSISSGTEVRSVLPDGCGGWYVGGSFAHSGHLNLLHIKRDKSVDATWNPGTTGGGIRTMLLSQPVLTQAGRLYIGGTFTAVNGVSSAKYLAAVTTPSCDGAVAGGALVTAWNPGPDGAVYALAAGMNLNGTALESIFAGGGFSSLANGGVSRSKVAQLNLSDGAPTPWDPSAQPATSTVYSLAVTANQVYVGGGFTSIGGQARANLAEIGRGGTGAATEWAPDPDKRVDSLALAQKSDPPAAQSPALATIYVGGQFTTIGSPASSRSRAAELNLADNGSATPWNPSLTGTSGQAFVPLTATDVIVGGAFDQVQGIPRSRLAETAKESGAPYDWNPSMDKAVYSLSNASPLLAVGGLFTTVGGGSSPQLAFFCAVSGPPTCSAP